MTTLNTIAKILFYLTILVLLILFLPVLFGLIGKAVMLILFFCFPIK